MNEEEIKLCVKCRYARHRKLDESYSCRHPNNMKESINLVDGRKTVEYKVRNCLDQRYFQGENRCGESAEWWEEKS